MSTKINSAKLKKKVLKFIIDKRSIYIRIEANKKYTVLKTITN